MTVNIYDFPDRSNIEKEAGKWLIRLDGDTQLTTDEINQLRDWLNRSPLHRKELSNLLNFYDKMNVLTELSVPHGNPLSDKSKPSAATPKGSSNFGILFGQKAFGLAMAVLAVSVVILLILSNQQASNLNHSGLYATAIGEQTSVELPDGSVMQLNTNSQVNVKYDPGARNIKLIHGEAYFKVLLDPQRPFSVYAGKGRVEAIGTEFSVRLIENDIDVTVAEGRVMLVALEEPPGTEIMPEPVDAIPENYNETTLGILDAGQSTTIRAIITSAENSPEKSIELVQEMDEEEVYQRLSWRDGLLIFYGDPLEDVIREISRYSPVTIEILDPRLKTIRIGGQFRVGDVEAMLASLETNFKIRIIRLRNNHIQIAAVEE